MRTHTYLEHGVSILNARLRSPLGPIQTGGSPSRPFITISREACAGATTLGRRLVPLLDEQLGEEDRKWLFLDKDLITHALTKHNLPERLAAYLPEDRISEIKALVGELVGLHPSLWELEQKISEVIVQLAHLGSVIFAGRAAHLVTHSLAGGFHLRLVASMESRIKRMMELQNCDAAAAEAELLNTDRARQRYAQTNFGKDLSDPHLYDLVINTDRFTSEAAARLVVATVRERMAAAAAPAMAGK